MSESLPPGPPGALLQLALYAAHPQGYVGACARLFGDPFTVPTPWGKVVVTGTPEGAREVLAIPEDVLGGFGAESTSVFLGEHSLMLLGGARHREARRLLAPLLDPSRGGEALRREMAQIAVDRIRSLPPGRPFSMREATQDISLSIIVSVLLGLGPGARAEKVRRAILRQVEAIDPALFFFPRLRVGLLGRGRWARWRRAAGELDAILFDEIRRRRSAPGAGVLAGLIAARTEGGAPLANQAIRDHLVTLLVAGHETTGLSLAWALHWLHREPGRLAVLREELGRHREVFVSPELDRLPYLSAVVHETLRLHPVVPEFMRQLRAPARLFGHHLPAGTGLAVSVDHIHRREEIFPEALAFRPERFIGRTYRQGEHLPFGGGTFRCTGAALATIEMKVVLAALLGAFDLDPVPGPPPRPSRRNWVVGPSSPIPMTWRLREGTASQANSAHLSGSGGGSAVGAGAAGGGCSGGGA